MSLMEEFLPHHQFSERHQITVRCRPGEVLDVVQEFEQPRDRLSEIAMHVRQLPDRLLRRLERSQAPRQFTIANFTPLGRDGDREIVAGLVGKFWRPDFGLRAIGGPSKFLACNPKHTAKLVIGFVAEPVGEATRLTTETRVYCPSRYALIMFTLYWIAIRPVSGLLRRRALGAIRRIAESRAVNGQNPAGATS